jgi:probable rRNA maturation factor
MSGARGGALQLDCIRAARSWAPPRSQLARWAQAALGRRAAGAELAVRIVGAGQSRRLNRAYRGKDKPTNVLSFPPAATSNSAAATSAGAAPRMLGDLVVCAPVVRSEARTQGKALRAHWAHLIVHGALHLAGYDHEQPADARRMERREIAVLRALGFSNPYRSEER